MGIEVNWYSRHTRYSMANDEPNPVIRNVLGWFLWWRIDETELEEQLTKYDSFPPYKSARGLGAILLALSAIVTLGVAIYAEEYWSLVDVFVLLSLAFFVILGYRWAMMGAMIVWSFEKLFGIVLPLLDGSEFSNPVIQVIWWTTYMHVLYLAWKTEGLHIQLMRQNMSQVTNGSQTTSPTPHNDTAK